jgi:hypothetical protein
VVPRRAPFGWIARVDDRPRPSHLALAARPSRPGRAAGSIRLRRPLVEAGKDQTASTRCGRPAGSGAPVVPAFAVAVANRISEPRKVTKCHRRGLRNRLVRSPAQRRDPPNAGHWDNELPVGDAPTSHVTCVPHAPFRTPSSARHARSNPVGIRGPPTAGPNRLESGGPIRPAVCTKVLRPGPISRLLLPHPLNLSRKRIITERQRRPGMELTRSRRSRATPNRQPTRAFLRGFFNLETKGWSPR